MYKSNLRYFFFIFLCEALTRECIQKKVHVFLKQLVCVSPVGAESSVSWSSQSAGLLLLLQGGFLGFWRAALKDDRRTARCWISVNEQHLMSKLWKDGSWQSDHHCGRVQLQPHTGLHALQHQPEPLPAPTRPHVSSRSHTHTNTHTQLLWAGKVKSERNIFSLSKWILFVIFIPNWVGHEEHLNRIE